MFKTFHFLLSLFILLNLVSCGKNSKDEIENLDQEITADAIINGKSVPQKNKIAEQIIAIEIESEKGKAICTGTIIENHHVLTAAHCVDNNPKNIKIIFSNNIKKDSHTFLNVDKYIQHPNWNRHLEQGEGDLALLHFKGEVPPPYTKAELANEKFQIEASDKITVAGFGVSNGITHRGSGILRYATTEVLNRKNETEVVVDGRVSSVCFGDSGGPAFVSKNKKYIQWGVASSVSRESCDEIAIHTEVMPYLNWINKIINKKSK